MSAHWDIHRLRQRILGIDWFYACLKLPETTIVGMIELNVVSEVTEAEEKFANLFGKVSSLIGTDSLICNHAEHLNTCQDINRSPTSVK